MTTLNEARAFFRSPGFQHGFAMVASVDDAMEEIETARLFYPGDRYGFCGDMRQILRVHHDKEHALFQVCLRVHDSQHGHGWKKHGAGYLGQSLTGWAMVRDVMMTLETAERATQLRCDPDVIDVVSRVIETRTLA